MNEEQTKQTGVQTEPQTSCSVVKTPLVDALRSYFGQGISEELIEQQRNYTATSWSPI